MFPTLFTIPAFQLYWHIPAIPVHTYGVLLATAMLVGLWVAGRQGPKEGVDSARVTDMAIYALIAGIIGAKLLLIAVEWRYFSAHWREIWTVLQSGGVFYGGLLGALPVAWWYARRHKLPGWQTADALAPGVVIGQAIGRLGCFAAGCCHGKPAADLPWAVTFKNVAAARTVGTPLDIPLHPTQLYEALATLLIFVVLVLWVSPRKRFNGQVAALYFLLYSAARFVIEFYRGDSVRGFVQLGRFALSTSQVIAILLFVGSLALLPYLSKRQRATKAAAA
jgi:phosphatidylglycerol:prolipoprotein diacylglycerol transferase